jgi:glycerophosphoryl diester phosphodiesterase
MPPPWPYPRVLAHRGGGAFAPENTIAAIRAGRSRGFRGAEFDVTLAGDGEAVLMHDLTLERTTDGRGPVARRSWAELQRLDAGGWFAPAFAGEPIPSLAQAVACCRSEGVWINAEIKPAAGTEAQTGERVARILEQGFADVLRGAPPAGGAGAQLPQLSSFSVEARAAARDAVPALPRGLLCTRIPRDWSGQLQRLQCVALHCDHQAVDAATVAAIRDAGYWVFVYTVNDRQRGERLKQWGIDALCTDRLDRIEPTLLD